MEAIKNESEEIVTTDVAVMESKIETPQKKKQVVQIIEVEEFAGEKKYFINVNGSAQVVKFTLQEAEIEFTKYVDSIKNGLPKINIIKAEEI
jgi:hypothetical protein